MRVVGLTGGIGSGKSTVAEYFTAHQIPIIDADLIAHQLSDLVEVKEAIVSVFGTNSLGADGNLNRRWLREEIHQHELLRHELEQIFHTRIIAQCKSQIQANAGAAYTILMVPLLLEKPEFKALCSNIIAIESAEELRINRVMQRSGLARESVVAIINNQYSDAQRRQEADFLIYNDRTLGTLSKQVDHIDQQLRLLHPVRN
ncbi:dephospho-CoA kinase [Chitinibacter sp. GC72]|uniref:dephospho-CoA kinase n=1 Tax=Chitinibacter sp. GC72 TaxID=1526917 RepID=UPI0012FB282B|nr:dephospho-CoA kinase [Chitinibacter sp. GC72]